MACGRWHVRNTSCAGLDERVSGQLRMCICCQRARTPDPATLIAFTPQKAADQTKNAVTSAHWPLVREKSHRKHQVLLANDLQYY